MPAFAFQHSELPPETTSPSARVESQRSHKSQRSFVCDQSCRRNVRARPGQERSRVRMGADSLRPYFRARCKTASTRNRERTDVDVRVRLRSKFLATACAFACKYALAVNHVSAMFQDRTQSCARLRPRSFPLRRFALESATIAGFPESSDERK